MAHLPTIKVTNIQLRLPRLLIKAIKWEHMYQKLLLSIIIAGSFLSCSNPYYDEPPLHDAAMRGNVEKVKELIEDGHKPSAKNKEGATPLHWAAFKGHVDVAKILIKNGAKVNALTNKGSTPLRLATTHKQNEMIKFLKSKGAR